MRTAFKLTFASLVVMLVIGVLATFGVYRLALRSLPDYTGEFKIAAVEYPVTILRDAANVPHIVAQTDSDAMFALGYAHAQDRLWQMILQRRTVQGRLSEIFGPESLPLDRLMRSLDLYGLARTSLPVQSEAARAALDAYAAGINARLTQINLNAEGRGAPELFLFKTPVAPWRAMDSLALMKLRAFVSSEHLSQELRYGTVALRLSDEARLSDLFAADPKPSTVAAPLPFNRPFERPLAPGSVSPVSTPLWQALLEDRGASNVFAVSSARAAKGAALLAHDPHGALRAPAPYYLAHLRLSGGDVIGATQPGVPLVLFGRKAGFAWGTTTAHIDDSDVLMVAEEESAGFTSRRSIIKIKGGASNDETYLSTAYGPVLPREYPRLAPLVPPSHVPVLRSTILEAQDRSFTARFNMMMAKDVAEFHAARRDYIAPALNFAVADQRDVYFFTAGALAQRDARHASQGRWPALAAQERNLWQGTRAASEDTPLRPAAQNVVMNTNNKLTDAPFPGHMSHFWGDTQRIRRLQSIMQSRDIHSRESFMEIQRDTVSYDARALLPLVAKDMWYAGVSPDQSPSVTLRQAALALLGQWDGTMDQHTAEPLIYSAWMNVLQRNLIQDELGPDAALFERYNPLFIERVFRDIGGAGVWCDIKPTTVRETCAEMAQRSLDEALALLGNTHGTNMEAWRWGTAHMAVHENTTMGRFPLLRWLATIRQPVSGGDHTLNMARSRGGNAGVFETSFGATYRGVYDMSDPDGSLFIISTGQSGHILSRHYDDLGALWRRGEYIPMSMDLELAQGGKVGLTRILPLSTQ